MVWDSVDMKSYKSSSTIPILFVGQPHINNSDTFCWTTTQCSILWLWIRSTAVPGGGGGGGGTVLGEWDTTTTILFIHTGQHFI